LLHKVEMHGMRRIPINSPFGLFILKIFAMREQTACAYTLTAVLIDGLPFFLPKILVDKSVLFQSILLFLQRQYCFIPPPSFPHILKLSGNGLSNCMGLPPPYPLLPTVCFRNRSITTTAPINAGKNNRNERCNKVNTGKPAGTIFPNNTEILSSAKPLPPGLGAK